MRSSPRDARRVIADRSGLVSPPAEAHRPILPRAQNGAVEDTERIIGGMFALQDPIPSRTSPPPFLGRRELLLVNGQSGIAVVIDFLSPATVWLPSYLCQSVVGAVHRGDVSVRFYDVGENLAITSADWVGDVRPGDVVLVIDYFGFPFQTECADRARARGAWVVEDACQALLSERAGRADFVVFSPRKFLGLPDGGIVRIDCAVGFDGLALQAPPAQWWLTALRASILRREFDLYGGAREWFQLFQRSEAEAPCGPLTMSELSRNLLLHCFDYVQIAERRRGNYAVLADALGGFAVFPDLPAGVVPLGFPMRAENRDHLRQTLFRHRMYPPVHWPIAKIVPAEFEASHRLASQILTLPCDQRYVAGDMEKMAKVVLETCRS